MLESRNASRIQKKVTTHDRQWSPPCHLNDILGSSLGLSPRSHTPIGTNLRLNDVLAGMDVCWSRNRISVQRHAMLGLTGLPGHSDLEGAPAHPERSRGRSRDWERGPVAGTNIATEEAQSSPGDDENLSTQFGSVTKVRQSCPARLLDG
ncbi:hypothetical protein BC826DRAFT_152737 [Russula brevipes]|nr:hypothetical protein BC826DRAFT_152737 [Russula brevipes]